MYGSPLVEVLRTPEEEICAIIIVTVPMMIKEEWKKLVNNNE